MIGQSVLDAFWANVDKSGECWLWTGPLTGDGYGRSGCIIPGSTAHQLAYVFQHGLIPRNMLVCHACDVKTCTRGSHLYAGTHSDNTRDAIRNGRIVYKGLWNRHPVQLDAERWKTAIAWRRAREQFGLFREDFYVRGSSMRPGEDAAIEQGLRAATPEQWALLSRLTGRSYEELVADIPPFPSSF